MGLDKARLPFGDEPMLVRVVRRLRAVVDRVRVVAAAGQPLPPLDDDVEHVCDHAPDRGPLEGLSAGLDALSASVEAAYVTSCDVPLLQGAFVEKLFELLGACDIAVPHVEGFHHPLSAVYRPRVVTVVRRLLDAGRMRPVFLFAEAPTRVVEADELRAVDPDFLTLRNLNHPDDYRAAMQAAGFVVPPEIEAQLRRDA